MSTLLNGTVLLLPLPSPFRSPTQYQSLANAILCKDTQKKRQNNWHIIRRVWLQISADILMFSLWDRSQVIVIFNG